MPPLGERFRAAREARGLSLADVSEQIRIRSVYLAAIEDENWSAIGAPVYIRGFLRTYARFLGLDPEEVVAAFAAGPGTAPAAGPSAPETRPAPASAWYAPAEVPERRPSRVPSLAIGIAAVIASILVAFVVYNELTMRRTAPPPMAIASPTVLPSYTPAAAGSAAAGPTASAGSIAASPEGSTLPSSSPSAGDASSLGLVLSESSWLRVTVDGNVSMEGTFPAGTAKTFHGRSASLRIGNAGGVEVYVDGKDVGKLGKAGDVVEKTFTL